MSSKRFSNFGLHGGIAVFAALVTWFAFATSTGRHGSQGVPALITLMSGGIAFQYTVDRRRLRFLREEKERAAFEPVLSVVKNDAPSASHSYDVRNCGPAAALAVRTWVDTRRTAKFGTFLKPIRSVENQQLGDLMPAPEEPPRAFQVAKTSAGMHFIVVVECEDRSGRLHQFQVQQMVNAHQAVRVAEPLKRYVRRRRRMQRVQYKRALRADRQG